jgi:nitrate/nitrite transport system ATP-binding protein
MTNGPEARIAEMVHVSIARPRSRETIIEHPHYYKIRNHIIHFLVRHAKHETGDRAPLESSTNGTPVVVNFDEESVATR